MVIGILFLTFCILFSGLGYLYWKAHQNGASSNQQLKECKQKCDELAHSYELSEAKLKLITEQKEKDEAKLKKFNEQIKLEFENLSHKIFNEKTSQFKKDSKEQISTLLHPFQEKIRFFQEKVDQYYSDESKERHSLKNEIGKLVQVNDKINHETQQLTQALKGDSKLQGTWGEVVLNRVLEASGLRENEEYVVQGKGLKLQSESGVLQKPDVVINLPQGRNLIIDAKVSLTSYVSWHNTQDSKEREQLLKQFMLSIRNHISNLSSKEYQYSSGLNTPDFVFLFFPMESAFSLALQTDPKITDEAWKKSIVIVSPTTLLATLRTVAFMWQRERERKNVFEISKKAGDLYDKFVGFSEDLKQVGHNLEKSTNSYHEAYKKLCTGKGNIVSRLEDIKKLGARAEKKINKEMIQDAEL